jgi:hypothetical protein
MTTLADAQENLAAAQAAYRAALAARSASSDGQSVSYQEIDKLRAEVTYWERVIRGLSSTANQSGGYSVARWTR